MPQFLPYNTLAEGDEFRDADGNVVETFNPDVTTNAPVADNILVYNGTEWVPMAAGGGGGGNPDWKYYSIYTNSSSNRYSREWNLAIM